jgi:hypothetical protein
MYYNISKEHSIPLLGQGEGRVRFVFTNLPLIFSALNENKNQF